LTVALVTAITAAVAACSSASDPASERPRPSAAFCAAAARFDERVPTASLAEQIRMVRRLVATAPPDVADEARTFLDALRRVRTDPSVRDDPGIKRAVDDLNRRAAQDCGWFRRRGL
jgi:hypothetical protein